MITNIFRPKQFVLIILITSVWINISEVFRYFVLVMPRVKQFFEYKEGIAEMDWVIFTIWGFWDTLLTALLVLFFWLYANSFGFNLKSVLISSTILWSAVFVIFWIATANMGLSDWNILLITLPLSWLEMVVGTWIVYKLYIKISGKEILEKTMPNV
ncbi:hypothetical protein AWE51_23390 [Aquimarina aggregata]|uniref:Uncharacterized protein n=1 Tax=Aquimarina aggregata TaxID=1642818 RepID=A0A163B6H9_9FLAO|nr:hypothetical protein [Aquimarina aggregata]KZS41100.1 hypothetical protein AWE51_23390 [Aquimarina aggregata]